MQHNAFNSRIGDFARFSQAIWSVLDGRFLYTPIPGRSIMGDHFSPIMVIAAPFLLIWPDERVLFIVQTINITATGLILYAVMREERPTLAPWLLLAFFLNPAVHDFMLADFRRIFFGLPWMALAMWGLIRKDRRMLIIGLLIALLAKETVALYIAMIGLYIWVTEKDWRWGIGLFVFGMVALLGLSEIVIPAFGGGENYPQLFYYSHLGDSYSEILTTILTRPVWFMQQVIGPDQLFGIFRILLPLGFLCLLEPRLTLVCAPFALLMFMSGRIGPIRLEEHYSASMTPVLFTAIIIGVRLIPQKYNRWVAGWMAVSVLVGYFLFSHAPYGGYYQPNRFRVDDHDRAGSLIAKRVPEEINLLAHTHYTPHLTHVNDISVFLDGHEGSPFSADRLDAADYVFIDRKVSQLNLGLFETENVVQNLLADHDYKIIEEIDGIFFFERTMSDHPAISTDVTYADTMHLAKVELAMTDAQGFYVPIDQPYNIQAGSRIRISLFWESLQDDDTQRTVSIRLSAFDGFMLAQQDQTPAEGMRPTAFWKEGEKVRDIYYLDIPADRAGQNVAIDLVVYDSANQNIYKANNSEEIYQIALLLAE
ncbi:MAG: DUF2079 domain-containing protein [Chloroflexota bacterium]